MHKEKLLPIIKDKGREARNTSCHLLWDSVFINSKGDVYSCCYSKPGVLGNIYRSNLGYLWRRNTKLKLYRSISQSGYLDYICNRTTCPHRSVEVKNYMNLKAPIDYPRNLQIEYGNYCNLECIMCHQRSSRTNNRHILENNALKKNIDWSRIQKIMFHGGEILAMKGGKEFYLWLTQKMNKKVELITNGTLIDDEWAEHIVKGSNIVLISVNAATEKTHELINKNSRFKVVINNIKRLINAKIKNCSEVKIVYSCPIMRENMHEIAEAILFSNNLGCDVISYDYVYYMKYFLEENNKLKIQIKKKIQNVLKNKKLKINLYRDRLASLGLL